MKLFFFEPTQHILPVKFHALFTTALCEDSQHSLYMKPWSSRSLTLSYPVLIFRSCDLHMVAGRCNGQAGWDYILLNFSPVTFALSLSSLTTSCLRQLFDTHFTSISLTTILLLFISLHVTMLLGAVLLLCAAAYCYVSLNFWTLHCIVKCLKLQFVSSVACFKLRSKSFLGFAEPTSDHLHICRTFQSEKIRILSRTSHTVLAIDILLCDYRSYYYPRKTNSWFIRASRQIRRHRSFY